MFLSHRDDIADHAKFAAHFHCPRVMHEGDGAARLGIEHVTAGEAPVALGADLLCIPTPGHTRGHQVLLYRDQALFTGDHLAWSPARDTLIAFRDACWYSWPVQTRSMERLLDYRFEWVLPGHGRIHHAPADEMHEHLERCVEWMKTATLTAEICRDRREFLLCGLCVLCVIVTRSLRESRTSGSTSIGTSLAASSADFSAAGILSYFANHASARARSPVASCSSSSFARRSIAPGIFA